MSQTAYTFYQGNPFAGALGLYDEPVIRSYVNADAVGFPFGIAVKQGVNDQDALLPTGSGDKILGITVHTHAVEPFYLPATPTTVGVPLKGTVGVLRQGTIWAVPEVNIAVQDPVYARYSANGGLTQLGSLRNDGDTSHALQITQAVWVTSATAPAVAMLEINLP